LGLSQAIVGCMPPHHTYVEMHLGGGELVYSDPPYVQSTRRSRRRYRFDCTDDDYVALLGILKSLPCRVMVSGHPSAFHDEYLAD